MDLRTKRQADFEGTSPAWRIFDRDGAAMAIDDLPRQSQSQPSAPSCLARDCSTR